jgi:DNA helicase-2/ATP-dependent DNA helicase PcrA
VAATRALHELCVLHVGDLTGLIADPVPENEMPDFEITTKGCDSKTEKTVTQDDILDLALEKALGKVCMTEKPTTLKTAKPTVVAKTKAAVVAHTKPAGNILPKTPYTNYSSTYAKSTGTLQKPSAVLSSQRQQLQSGLKPTVKPVITPQTKVKAVKSASGTAFGDIPSTECLRPMGHSKIDLSVMWVTKQKDGLYLQLRYGVLRLCPISSDVIRITFSRGSQIIAGTHPKIAIEKCFRGWMHKDTSKSVAIWTENLYLQVDKATGAIQYMTSEKDLLVSERKQECRMIERSMQGDLCSWLYLDFPKGEKIYTHRIADKFTTSLRGVSRYFSHGSNTKDLPLLASEKGYGFVMATDASTFFCDIPSYGSFICMEKEEKLDYYFLKAQNDAKLLEIFEWLSGKDWSN